MSAQDIFLHVAHLSLSIVPLKSILVVCIHRSQLHHVRLFVIPWTSARQASLSITNSQSLLRLMFIESKMPSNHLILCCPLLLLPSLGWPKYWSVSFSISPFNACSARISFRIDWFALLAVQGTLFQHHSSKASIIQCLAFFMVQLSCSYKTTGETIALTAAKSLQSCLTPCNPRDSSPPGSPIPGILQARTLEWVAISFSNA